MCAMSQNAPEIEFEGTHYFKEPIYYIGEKGFILKSELSIYIDCYEPVMIKDDLVLDKYGSSVPLSEVENILVQITSD